MRRMRGPPFTRHADRHADRDHDGLGTHEGSVPMHHGGQIVYTTLCSAISLSCNLYTKGWTNCIFFLTPKTHLRQTQACLPIIYEKKPQVVATGPRLANCTSTPCLSLQHWNKGSFRTAVQPVKRTTLCQTYNSTAGVRYSMVFVTQRAATARC